MCGVGKIRVGFALEIFPGDGTNVHVAYLGYRK